MPRALNYCTALHSGLLQVQPPQVGCAFVFHDPPSPCILGTHHEKGAQTFWSVVNRLPLSSNAVLCWKFCHVFHKLLRDGHPNVSSWGCGGWLGARDPCGESDCLCHKGHCPLLHGGWQLPLSPGLLVTDLRWVCISGQLLCPTPDPTFTILSPLSSPWLFSSLPRS